MTRRVMEHQRALDEGKPPTTPRTESPGIVRVAGQLRERDAREVQRIASVLEVAAWARRVSQEPAA